MNSDATSPFTCMSVCMFVCVATEHENAMAKFSRTSKRRDSEKVS